MNLNKKSFMELMRKITKKNTLEKFNIIIWHGDSAIYKNALYIELMFTINNNCYVQSVSEEEELNLYYGEELEDTKDNLKIIYKQAKDFRRKIKTWINGTWLKDIEIVIQEENI